MTMLNHTQSTLLGGATDAVLSMRDVKVHYPVKEGLLQQVTGHVRAVDGVSLSIPRGQTLGLVGESGCGKTTLGRVISGLVSPTDGELWVDVSAEDQKEINRLRALSPQEMSSNDQSSLKRLRDNHLLGSMTKEKQRQYRRNCQVVFQDAFSSLNPRQLVRDIVGRPLRVHREASGDELDEKWVSVDSTFFATPTSSREVNVSAFPLLEPSPSTPNSWCWMSQRVPSMCRYKRKS
jgi:ABC-type glutathione transport system ATPase component